VTLDTFAMLLVMLSVMFYLLLHRLLSTLSYCQGNKVIHLLRQINEAVTPQSTKICGNCIQS